MIGTAAAVTASLPGRAKTGKSIGRVAVAGSMRGFGGRPGGRLTVGLEHFLLKTPPLPPRG
jgi:hypothetical protein